MPPSCCSEWGDSEDSRLLFAAWEIWGARNVYPGFPSLISGTEVEIIPDTTCLFRRMFASVENPIWDAPSLGRGSSTCDCGAIGEWVDLLPASHTTLSFAAPVKEGAAACARPFPALSTLPW